MNYQTWIQTLNRINQSGWLYDSENSLAKRLYESDVSVEDAWHILHQQSVTSVNIFASKLLEQIQQGLSYTVWDDLQIRHPHVQSVNMDLCFDKVTYVVVDSEAKELYRIVKTREG